MKKVIIATILSAAISVPAFAASSNDLADANLIFNMDNSQSMELAVLSPDEMKSTEGAFWHYAIGGLAGGLGGHYGYYAGSSFGNSYSFLGHMASIGMGVIGGVASPVRGIGQAAWGLGFGTVSGGFQGWAGSRGTTYRW